MTTPSGRKPRILLAVLGLLALSLVVSIAVLAITKLREPSDDGPDHPDAWDERVLPLVKQVEKLRGRTFKEPVYVDFLPVAEFKKDVRQEQDDLSDEDRDELEQAVELLRALGLIQGDLDIVQALQDLSSGGTLAYYTPEKERIRIRGTKLTPAITSTLVHELTHALQDQHFDLEEKLESFDDDEGTAAMVFRAVVEGDASRIATAWAAQLPADEQQALQRAQIKESEQGRKDLADLPTILVTQMSTPYALGEPLVTVATLADDAAADRLLASPPRTEEMLLDPFLLDTPASEVVDVDAPRLSAGEEEFDSGEFGALTLFLVLAERLDPLDALAAADGWGGDRYVAYRGSDDLSCVRASFVGDTEQDTTEISDALTTWARATPEHTEVRAADGVVHLQACDPGAAADVGTDSSEEALTMVATRAGLGAMLAQSGLPRAAAQCVGTAAIEEFTIEELSTTDLDAAQRLQGRMIKLMTGCMG